jgi:hypothetical protein
MEMKNIPFATTDWSRIVPTEHKGETGMATWCTQQFGELRVRMVEYSPGYLADHWCSKGHILLFLEGDCRVGNLSNSLQSGDFALPSRPDGRASEASERRASLDM